MEGLRERYDVTGIDRRGGKASRRVQMSRLGAARRAFRGGDVVVDLAANPDPHQDWSDAYGNNIAATWNALEAAADAGVRRVIFASSNHVTGGYEADEPYASVLAGRLEGLDPAALRRITPSDPPRPDGPYALSKVFGEAAGRYFSDFRGLSVICLRIGGVRRDDRPRDLRALSVLLSHRDLVQLVDRCIVAPPELRFAVLYGVSANTWRIWDIESAKRLVGYAPEDNAESWRTSLSGEDGG